MSWASKLLHIGEAAAGVGLIIGTGGAATPWATGLIAGGAGGLVQDFAGDKAEKQQKEATTAAQKIGNDALAEQRRLLSPTANLSQGAGMNLASLMGGGFTLPATGMSTPSASSLSDLNSSGPAMAPNAPDAPPSDAPSRTVPRVMMNPDDMASPQAMNLSSFGTPNVWGRGTVRLVAPDGTERDVPPALAQHYISRGARPAEGAGA